MFKLGILTVSDRAFRKEYPDTAGPAIERLTQDYIQSPFETVCALVPDDKKRIKEELLNMRRGGCALIVTTGGTGPAPNDVTVDATREVIEKELPGFGELMRRISLKQTPTAILSRQTAGIVKQTLIVNLPGNPMAIDICLQGLFPAIVDCLYLIAGFPIELNPEKIQYTHRHREKKGVS